MATLPGSIHKDVTGQYFGGAMWHEGEYRVTLTDDTDGDTQGFVLTVQISDGTEVSRIEFTDTQADEIVRAIGTSEEIEDLEAGLGLRRELHWRLGDHNNEVDLDMNDLEEFGAYLRFALGMDEYDGTEEWVY